MPRSNIEKRRSAIEAETICSMVRTPYTGWSAAPSSTAARTAGNRANGSAAVRTTKTLEAAVPFMNGSGT